MSMRGFSLIEVLLALVVISLGAMLLGLGVGQGTARLENGWRMAAAQRFARSTAERLGIDLAFHQGDIDAGDRTFSARLEQVDPGKPDLIWYNLSVTARDQPDRIIFSIPVVRPSGGAP